MAALMVFKNHSDTCNVLENTKNVFKILKCIGNIICSFKDIVKHIICFEVHSMYCKMYMTTQRAIKAYHVISNTFQYIMPS